LRSGQWFVSSIGILAVIGLVSLLLNHPFSLLRTLFSIVIVTAIFVFAFRFFLTRGTDRAKLKDQKAFLKAAKKSKRRLKQRLATTHSSSTHSSKPRKKTLHKKSNVKLTVIEGKKNKKKNRAMF